MKQDTFHFWLKRITISFYIYAFAMTAIMYFVGYKPILPNRLDKDYPVLVGVPSVSQESIIKAVNNFEIQVPILSIYPSLDMDMDETHLGETLYLIILHMCIPTIGPGAFTSWGKLGETLAHEVEVHCNQNWWKSITDKIFSDDSTPILEREAYIYTILDHKRFHLTNDEVMDTLTTMLFQYPIGDKNEQRQSTSKIKERIHRPTKSP